MAAALKHPRANVSGMETPTIRVLWGPGGGVELTDFGHDGEPARIYDLTNLAAFLVARGLGYQRKVCRPSEVNGAIAVTLGDDGRAQWVDGGGDISADDVGWAIAAALETGGVQLFDEAVSDHLARDAARCAAALVATMVALGATTRGATTFVDRARPALGGRSIVDVWSARSAEHVGDAVELMVNHIDKLLDRVADQRERTERRDRALAHLEQSVARPAVRRH